MIYEIDSIKKNIKEEKDYLSTLEFDPTPISNIVKYHIDLWDPAQLLAMECPTDEYDGETRRITIFITRNLNKINEESLSEKINEIFIINFGNEYFDNKEVTKVGEAIYSALKENKFIG
jgi:hypothetical protein